MATRVGTSNHGHLSHKVPNRAAHLVCSACPLRAEISNGIAQVPADGGRGLAEATGVGGAGRLAGNLTAGRLQGGTVQGTRAACDPGQVSLHLQLSLPLSEPRGHGAATGVRGIDGLRGRQPRSLACA